MIPAKAASAEPIAKVTSTMAVKLTPMVRAVSSSCATARMARPSLVRLSSICRPTMISVPAASISTLSSRRLNAPRSMEFFGSSAGNGLGLAPCG
jgi:hypothetical protein